MMSDDVGTKRGREHVSGINTDQETEHVSKKRVLPCLASFCQSQLACHASRLSCKQSLRNTGNWQAYAHKEWCISHCLCHLVSLSDERICFKDVPFIDWAGHTLLMALTKHA